MTARLFVDLSAFRSPAGKRRYHVGRAMPPTLAHRYWREFGAVRRILDLGCGAGDFGRLCPLAQIEVHGVDLDPGALRRARAWEQTVRADLETGALPYRDGCFDAVLAKDIFEHVQVPGRLAAEAYRVLRPGSTLVASIVMAKPRAVWADYTHVRGFTERSARLLLEDAGFVVEAVGCMGPVPLAQRLGLLELVPALLRLPIVGNLWAVSWEIRARKPAVRA
ncbi:MAG: class I SAM-dependent methyltransferase [Dehalococcoidia bacterium]